MTGLTNALLFGCLTLVAGRTITVHKISLSLTEESEDADELNDILPTVLGYFDVTSGEQYDDIVQGCIKGKCEFCKDLYGHEVCVVATSEKDAIVLEITFDKKQTVKTVVRGPNPPKMCKRSIPGIPAVKDVCIEIKDVNVQQLAGCVYVSWKFRGRPNIVKIGCFKIPTSGGVNQITEAGRVQVEERGTRADNHE
ncbi:uncharacterized protein LOC123541807 isoform X1 [Mercenaria mercenaria]|uniref:uncharacterized protein LOC123541807 isoform X1 n=1 Tax=Mercenaria mercenaria TaxID=6596 RepID=UPI00234EF812|nr:uncharacterized protein LOC123541807 isoform X1 [Mercenaria mercenaria]